MMNFFIQKIVNDKLLFTFCIAIVTFFLNPTVGISDELIMENGDRLHGTVVRMNDNVLEFKTNYAGVIKIQWNHVRTVNASKELHVFLLYGEPFTTLSIERDGKYIIKSINPEEWLIGNSYFLSGQTMVSLKKENGNSNQKAIDIQAELEWKYIQHRIKFFSELQYGVIDNSTTTDKWDVAFKYDKIISPYFYIGGRSSFKHDIADNLSLRYAVGPYVGQQIIKKELTNLSIDFGTEYVKDDYYGQPDNNYIAGAWSVDFLQKISGTSVEFYHRQKGNTRLNDLSTFFIDTWTGCTIPLHGGFRVGLEAQADFTNELPAGIDPWNTTYQLKFGYRW